MLHYHNAYMVLLVSIGNPKDKIIEDKIIEDKIMDFNKIIDDKIMDFKSLTKYFGVYDNYNHTYTVYNS